MTAEARRWPGFGLQVGRPLKPMLAASEASIDEALGQDRRAAAVEWKLDGIRVQAHIAHGEVRLFTRSLDDITDRLPEVVSVLATLPVRDAVFDGELIALRPDGRPYAFQDTASRAASEVDAHGAGTVPLSVFLFDVLHLDGKDLIDLPDAERHAALASVVPETMLMPRLVTDSPEEATAFFHDAVARGHEGVVVKSLTTPYAAGRRGAGWIKVKPRHTLDLVVLAVEWGHGRRKGWLSNLHLGARDPETGGWVMLGKTFKGLTDELLTWQTAAIPRTRRPPRRLDGLRPPGASRRDRLRRRPALPAIPGRRGLEIRPGTALPRRQDSSRSRHDRHGAGARAANRLKARSGGGGASNARVQVRPERVSHGRTRLRAGDTLRPRLPHSRNFQNPSQQGICLPFIKARSLSSTLAPVV